MSDNTCIIESRRAFERLQKLWEKLTHPIRVLVVEDDDRDAELIMHAIAGTRVESQLALTGAEAKQYLEQSDFNLCLLDLKLPDMDGAELIEWAKEANKPVPFFVLTGMADGNRLIKDALTAGAECIIQKPLSAENVRMIFGGAG